MLLDSLSSAFLSRAHPGLCIQAVLLRSLEGGPVAANELWWHGRTSKRAMKSIVKSAANQGLVAIDGAEVRLLTPLPPSEPARCPPLEALVSQLDLEHPHFPVPYGTADPTFTGGPGVDWKPVARVSPSNVDSLPITALLSQALVAFGIEYEKEHHGPIQWAANILRGIGDGGVDVATLDKRGTHGAPNLERSGLATVGRDHVVRLAATGRVVRDAYEPLCAQIESRWRDRLGSALIDEVIETVRVPGDWPPFPLVAWTGADFCVVGSGS